MVHRPSLLLRFNVSDLDGKFPITPVDLFVGDVRHIHIVWNTSVDNTNEISVPIAVSEDHKAKIRLFAAMPGYRGSNLRTEALLSQKLRHLVFPLRGAHIELGNQQNFFTMELG